MHPAILICQQCFGPNPVEARLCAHCSSGLGSATTAPDAAQASRLLRALLAHDIGWQEGHDGCTNIAILSHIELRIWQRAGICTLHVDDTIMKVRVAECNTSLSLHSCRHLAAQAALLHIQQHYSYRVIKQGRRTRRTYDFHTMEPGGTRDFPCPEDFSIDLWQARLADAASKWRNNNLPTAHFTTARNGNSVTVTRTK
jgi:hypothetical protein